jgi:hypothetical protein
VNSAFIRCFLILLEIRTPTAARNNVLESARASCESV